MNHPVNHPTNRPALGKGLASLIRPSEAIKSSSDLSKESLVQSDARFLDCKIEDIIPNRDQPRKLFEREKLEELTASIREKGVIEPLVVRALSIGKFELIAGERRLRASQAVGLKSVPVVIFDCEADEVMELALIENIQREDLNPIEEALAYRDLMERHHYTQEQLADRLGKQRSSVANTVRLLKLPEAIRGDIIESRLSMGHARALLGIENDLEKMKVRDQIIAGNLSVRDTESLIQSLKKGGRVRHESRTKAQDPQIKFLEEQMMQTLGTKVKIKPSIAKGRGQLVLDYYSDEDLDRVYQALMNA